MPVPIFNQALQVYYKDKSKFIIPKKDTDDYNKVIVIMNEIKNQNQTATKPTNIKSKSVKSVTKQNIKIIKSTEKPLQVSTNGDIKIK